MFPEVAANGLVVVALTAFYAGIARDFGTTLEFVDTRIGLGLSLGSYVGAGASVLLAGALIVFELLAGANAGHAGGGLLAGGLSLALLFGATVAVSFYLGVAIYGVLLRVGYGLT